MDESFQFIIESPQHAQEHKKRPRLVTSCDDCRVKKIKCLQVTPEANCEACKAANIPCRFRDRERYFAERSRTNFGPNVASSPSFDNFSVSSLNSFKPSDAVKPEGDSRSLSYPPRESRRSLYSRCGDSSCPRLSRNDPIGYGFVSLPRNYAQNFRSGSPASRCGTKPFPLFDPESPQFPHPTYMAHFIQLFFEQLGAEFSFVTHDEVSRDFWDQILSPFLANCIAAMATRYSIVSEITVRGLHNVAETYGNNAKAILASIRCSPSMDTLHGVMLLSWSEYKNNRIPGLRNYCQMAMRMAIDLGLSDQTVSSINISESERNRRRSTWASILQLHLTASSCSGDTPRVDEAGCSSSLQSSMTERRQLASWGALP
ncbi:hypothetical protein C8R43DRAFT_1189333 [Mycena crocata]|nr:hypothetical protein C8R43DRAFT_1189333 [Mycena crocata]